MSMIVLDLLIDGIGVMLYSPYIRGGLSLRPNDSEVATSMGATDLGRLPSTNTRLAIVAI